MQILKRGDIVNLPAKVEGFSTDGMTINVETIPGVTRVFCVPVDTVTVTTFSLSIGDRIRVNSLDFNDATVLGSSEDEVWVMPDGADKSATISRRDIMWRLPDFEPENPADGGDAHHG